MLTLHLEKKWFDKIKSGEKTHEYREMTAYWCKRLQILFKYCAEKVFLYEDPKRYIRDNVFHATKHIFHDSTNVMIKFACGYPKQEEENKFLYALVESLTVGYPGKLSDLKIDKPVFDIEFKLLTKGVKDG